MLLKNKPYTPFVPFDAASGKQIEHAFFRKMRAIVNADEEGPGPQQMIAILRVLGGIGLKKQANPDPGADMVEGDENGARLLTEYQSNRLAQQIMWREAARVINEFHTVVLLELNAISSSFLQRMYDVKHNGNRIGEFGLHWRATPHSFAGNMQNELRELVSNILAVNYPRLVGVFGILEVDHESIVLPFSDAISDEDRKGVTAVLSLIGEDYSELWTGDDSDDDEDDWDIS